MVSKLSDALIVHRTSEGIPQGNQLKSSKNQLIDHLKQTGIMEPLKTDWYNGTTYNRLF